MERYTPDVPAAKTAMVVEMPIGAYRAGVRGSHAGRGGDRGGRHRGSAGSAHGETAAA